MGLADNFELNWNFDCSGHMESGHQLSAESNQAITLVLVSD